MMSTTARSVAKKPHLRVDVVGPLLLAILSASVVCVTAQTGAPTAPRVGTPIACPGNVSVYVAPPLPVLT